MLFAIKSLTCLHYRSAKDIFEETFDPQEYPEFNLSWRLRSKTEFIGIFTREGDLLGFSSYLGFSKNAKVSLCSSFVSKIQVRHEAS
jgi:hypothetical protein